VPELRSDGDTSSLDGATGGVAPGARGIPPIAGLLPSGIGDAGTGRCAGGADGGGADCACAPNTPDTASTHPRMIAQSFTARSPV
jgi:hypothetical protein